jgi:anti-sigma factor RsiW
MKSEHLSWDLLVRAVDQELSQQEERYVASHLSGCSVCRGQQAEIESFSQHIEGAVSAVPVIESAGDREQIAARARKQDVVKPIRQAPEKVMVRFGWGMAIAATLALGIIIAPKQKVIQNEAAPAHPSSAAISNAIEVDGETFIALPYSNPDLPASAPRIVQMQVPVSSLADIGISLEPVTNQVLNQDRSVLADVLLGADGQPLGVHVVSWEY